MKNKTDETVQPSSRQNTLQSLENALKMINLFKDHDELGITQIATEMGSSKSTVFRMLRTLEAYRFVKQNQDTGRYRLGLRFAFFGDLARSRNEIIRIAHPHLVRLVEAVQEVSYLTVLEDSYRVRFIDRVAYSTLLNYGTMAGNSMPAYATANGKMLLAHLPSEMLEEFFSMVKLVRLTPATITSKKRLREEFAQIRESGYSFDNEESELGLSAYAMPIRDSFGNVTNAISITGPTGRIMVNKEEKLSLLKKTAQAIMNEIV